MIAAEIPELMESLRRLDRSAKTKIFLMLADDLSVAIEEPLDGGRPAMLPLIRASKSAVSTIENLEREAHSHG